MATRSHIIVLRCMFTVFVRDSGLFGVHFRITVRMSVSCFFWAIFGVCVLSIDQVVAIDVTPTFDESPLQDIKYTPAILRELRPILLCSHSCVTCQHKQYNWPHEGWLKNFRQRKRGKKGGVRVKNKGRKTKPYLPTIVFGNTRSLNNKWEELQASCQCLRQYREACLLGFIETWLGDDTNDTSASIDDFHLYRADRTAAAGKNRGGGVCLYVNEKWAHKSNTSIKATICTPDIELLTVNIRPYYLPREFSSVIVNVVYIPPTANKSEAIEVISSALNDQENKSPDAVKLIIGDFNHCSLESSLPHYHQYVTCTTRNNITLDLCYGSVPNAYKSVPLPPLGDSDHNNVHLLPRYRPLLKSSKPAIRTVKQWTTDATEELRGCLEDTNWNIFINACENVNELTDTVTCYIQFCESNTIKSKSIKSYPNNKPWVTKDLRHAIMNKKKLYRQNDKDSLASMNKEIKKKVKECKRVYKAKIESSFDNNDTKQTWKGLKKVTGYEPIRASIKVDNENQYVNDLNEFYARFDCHNFEKEQSDLRQMLKNDTFCNENDIKDSQVLNCFQNINMTKACGPDKISGKLLKSCCHELVFIFTFLFNQSLNNQVIPTMWKTAEIIPVPKKTSVACLNDLRPIALTPIVFKCFEKIVLSKMLNQVSPLLDPLQFAYKAKRNVEDALLLFTNNILKHLEISKTYARVLFIDFSSAFNTIQPHLMIKKLLALNVNEKLCGWILDFLTARSQYVNFQNVSSKFIVTNTGAPQGCVLSPVLYTIYTNDFIVSSNNTCLIKFADDSTLQGLISHDETSYFKEVNDFVEWCDVNFLKVNATKTKEMIFDFRKKCTNIEPLYIKNEKVEITNTYKYLGITIDKKLNWHAHVESLYKKSNQRMYLLRKLKSFQIRSDILKIFYTSTIQSLIIFGICCWGGNITRSDENKITRIIRRAEKIVQQELPKLNELFEANVIKKADDIKIDQSHPLNKEYKMSSRSKRLLSISARTERYKNSFIPYSTRMLQRN